MVAGVESFCMGGAGDLRECRNEQLFGTSVYRNKKLNNKRGHT